MQITNPDYISQEMFDDLLKDMFSLVTPGTDLKQQMRLLRQRFLNSSERSRILADIESVAEYASVHSIEGNVAIAYVMGMQLGFELAAHYPPWMSEA